MYFLHRSDSVIESHFLCEKAIDRKNTGLKSLYFRLNSKLVNEFISVVFEINYVND